MTGTTGTVHPGVQEQRFMGRRLVARGIDALVAFGLSCLLVWPFMWGSAADAVTAGGFDSVLDFIGEWDVGELTGGSVGAVVERLQPVVLSTVYLQALVVWFYEGLSTSLTGSTLGKAMTRLRVVRHAGTSQPTVAPRLKAKASWWDRPLRMFLRAALVVGPPALSLGMVAASAFAIPGAVELSEVAIALTVVCGVAWLATGVGLHGWFSGTRVLGFSWQELRAQATEQAQRGDEHAARLREMAGRSPAAQRFLDRAEHDPRTVQARQAAQQAAPQARQAVQQAGPQARQTATQAQAQARQAATQAQTRQAGAPAGAPRPAWKDGPLGEIIDNLLGGIERTMKGP